MSSSGGGRDMTLALPVHLMKRQVVMARHRTVQAPMFLRTVLCALALVTMMCGLAAPAAASLTLTAGKQQLTVEWSEPANNGAPINDYDVRYKLSSDQDWTNHPHSGTNRRTTITSLISGQSYNVQIRASNIYGWSDWSPSVTATVPTIPAAPKKPSLFSSNGKIQVFMPSRKAKFVIIAINGQHQISMVTPASNGGAVIIKYEARVLRASSNEVIFNKETINDIILTFELDNGVSYKVQVRAMNIVGWSDWSDPVSATPAAVPDAPDAPTLTVGNEQLTVEWAEPSNNGAAISDYDVQYRAGNSGNWTDANYDGTGTSTTITSLANGQSYQVQVLAKNIRGSSGWSPSASATPATIPTVPAAPTLIHGDGQIRVSWTAPASNGGATITVYEVRVLLASNDELISQSSQSSVTPVTFDLTNGMSYKVQVRAKNSVDWSGWSPSATATPAAVPAVPAEPTLTVGNKQLTVVWTAPADNGAPITDYDVQYRPGNSGGWTDASYDGTGTSATITGLTNGTSYQVQVRAKNSVDWSGWSPSATATPAAVPAVPAEPTLTVGNKQLTVVWTAPADNGAPITDYDVQYRPGNSGGWTDANYDGTGTSATITGLTNGTSYQVQVLAKNRVGSSGWSDLATGTPATIPTVPAAPTLIPGDGQIQVSWNAPDNNGAAINDYDVQYKTSSAAKWTDANYTGTSTSTTIMRLINGTIYQVRVLAKNSMGSSGWSPSTSATPVAAPVAPYAPTLTVGNQKLTVVWTAPADNGAPITDYDVQYRAGNNGTWTDASYDGTGTSTTIMRLINGTIYQVQVRARNSVGWSGWSPSTSATPAAQAPDAPGAPTLTPGNGELTVAWTAPAANGAPINDYDVRYRAGNNGIWTEWKPGTRETIGTTITGLINGTIYQVQVRATNRIGTLGWGTHTTGTPTAQVPAKPVEPAALDAPDAPTLTPGNGKLTVAWTAPAVNGAPITDYDVRYWAGNSGPWTDASYDGTGTSTTITSLINGTIYQVQVRAMNSVGWSGWSPSATGTPAAPAVWVAPSVPTDLVAAAGDGEVVLSWSASQGAGSIGYDLHYRSHGTGSWTHVPSRQIAGTPHTIDGLANGTGYEFQVRAVNQDPSGVWHVSAWSPSAIGTPAAPAVWVAPSVPTDLEAEAGSGEVVLSWSASQGSGSIGYDLQFRSHGTGSWTHVPSKQIAGTPHTIDGLANGTGYEFQVRAVNQDPTGVWHVSAWTAWVSATPAAQAVWVAPSMPTDLVAEEGDSEVVLSWSASTQGSGSIGYDLQFRSHGTGSWTRVPSGKITDTSHTIDGLANGTGYEFQVRAVNQYPSGVWHVSAWTAWVSATPAAQAVWVAPSMPTDLVAEEGDSEVVLSWSASTQGSGSIGYDLQFRSHGTGSWTRVPSGKITDTSHTIDGLANGTGYEFQVRAVNQYPSGVWHVSAWTALVSATPVAVAVASGSSAATPAAVAASAAAAGSVAHFVPTVAVQVVNSVAARLAAPRAPGMQATLAGNKLPSWDNAAGMAANPDPWPGARGQTGMGSRSLSAQEVVAGTSFAMTRGSADDNGFATVWGEGAMVHFERRHDGLTLDGAITSGFLGADWASERWLAGLAVGHSSSTGDYRGPDGSGKVKATLTGVYPYAGLRLTDALSAWAAAGHGTGKLTLKPGDGAEIETGLTMSMVAAGMRSTVLQPESDSGLSLALKGDARFTRTASDAAKGADGIHLAASDADVWQVRLGLEGSRHYALGNGRATATLSLEVGLRLDGGGAGRGFGADLGGGITFAEPESGLKLELKARGLIAHEAHDLREWEVSAALSYDKRSAMERGLKMSLEQSWDAASSGGMESLLERGTLAGLTANDNAPAKSRLVGEIGYGLAAFGDGFTGTPHAGFGYSSDGAHDYKVGWRLTPARPGGPSDPGFELGLEVNRKEAANGDTTDQGAMLSATIRW